MFRENDNLWKDIVSFKGCGQDDPPSRWVGQKIFLLILLALAIGVLIAAGLGSLWLMDWLGGE
jgi:hypothetical protein